MCVYLCATLPLQNCLTLPAIRSIYKLFVSDNFLFYQFLTEFVRKRGIGPLSFHDVPLKGKPKVFQVHPVKTFFHCISKKNLKKFF